MVGNGALFRLSTALSVSRARKIRNRFFFGSVVHLQSSTTIYRAISMRAALLAAVVIAACLAQKVLWTSANIGDIGGGVCSGGNFIYAGSFTGL